MRVEVDFTPVDAGKVRDAEHWDLRADAAALDRIEGAQRYPPLRNLLLNLNGGDSPFSTFGSKTWTVQEDGSPEPFVCASRVDLTFLREDANWGAMLHHDLAKRLAEMLRREAGHSLRAELQVCTAELGVGLQGFCLRVSMYAAGTTPAQAQLRWGLGMARVQQALLFIGRSLRQELEVIG